MNKSKKTQHIFISRTIVQWIIYTVYYQASPCSGVGRFTDRTNIHLFQGDVLFSRIEVVIFCIIVLGNAQNHVRKYILAMEIYEERD